MNPYLLSMQIIAPSYPDDNIPTNGAVDIARSVRNVSDCTLLRDVKLACNKHSDIARYHSLDFT